MVSNSVSRRRGNEGSQSAIQISVENPAEVLFQQDGEFEVTSPRGEVFRVRCQRGIGMAFKRVQEVTCRARDANWRIKRYPGQPRSSPR
jgi:hypothetical protein